MVQLTAAGTSEGLLGRFLPMCGRIRIWPWRPWALSFSSHWFIKFIHLLVMRFWWRSAVTTRLPRWYRGDESVNAGDTGDAGSIPRPGRWPGWGHSNPLKNSCLENPMNRGAGHASVPGVAQCWTWLNRFTVHCSVSAHVAVRPESRVGPSHRPPSLEVQLTPQRTGLELGTDISWEVIQCSQDSNLSWGKCAGSFNYSVKVMYITLAIVT